MLISFYDLKGECIAGEFRSSLKEGRCSSCNSNNSNVDSHIMVKRHNDFFLYKNQIYGKQNCSFLAKSSIPIIKQSFVLNGKCSLDEADDMDYLCPEETHNIFFSPNKSAVVNISQAQHLTIFEVVYTKQQFYAFTRSLKGNIQAIHHKIKNNMPFALSDGPLPIFPKMKEVIMDLCQCDMDKPFSGFYLKAKVSELLFLQFEQLQVYQEKGKLISRNYNDIKIYEAAELIRQNISRPLKLPELSLQTSTNEHFLKSGFKRVFQLSISEFLLRTRMEQAKQYIEEENYCMYEIADKLGYNHSESFIRAFKDYYGISPKRYYLKSKQEPYVGSKY
ncbi:AraC family transcriptional regulator [Marinilabiliaceae bacterium JC017]|nr:AraC family transcriptional regulator [Marinilabiliaceae bacterium JC017]